MLNSPNTFVAAGHFHFNGRSRRQRGKQAQAQRALQIAVQQQSFPLRGIKPGGLRKNRDPQEFLLEVNQLIAEVRGIVTNEGSGSSSPR